MLYRRTSRRYNKIFSEEVNPTDGIINLVDIMLVFSCGLLLALASYWSVDLHTKDVIPIDKGSEMTQMQQVKDNINQSDNGGSSYEKMGTVFRDPKTGQLYMLEE